MNNSDSYFGGKKPSTRNYVISHHARRSNGLSENNSAALIRKPVVDLEGPRGFEEREYLRLFLEREKLKGQKNKREARASGLSKIPLPVLPPFISPKIKDRINNRSSLADRQRLIIEEILNGKRDYLDGMYTFFAEDNFREEILRLDSEICMAIESGAIPLESYRNKLAVLLDEAKKRGY